MFPLWVGPGDSVVYPPHEKALLQVFKQTWWYRRETGGALGYLVYWRCSSVDRVLVVCAQTPTSTPRSHPLCIVEHT